MVVQPTVSHYREPLVAELLGSGAVEYDLFGLPTNVGGVERRDRIQHASSAILERVELIESRAVGSVLRWDRHTIGPVLRGSYDAYVLEGRIFTLSAWVALVLGKLLRRNVFLWGHGWKRDERGAKRLLRLFFYRLSGGLLLYGEGARARAVSYGLPAERLHVVFNSIYGDTLLTSLDTSRPSSTDDPLHLIVSCRLTSRHHIGQLAEALVRLDERHRLKVTVVGDGSERGALEHAFSGIDASFVGAVYDAERLADLYSQAHLAVSPAASGLNVIQAMGFGVPIVAGANDPTAGPELEAVTDGVTGLTFPVGDTARLAELLEWAAANRGELDRMGRNARRLVLERYTAERQARAFDTAIERWLSAKSE